VETGEGEIAAGRNFAYHGSGQKLVVFESVNIQGLLVHVFPSSFMWQDTGNLYGASSSTQPPYYQQPQGAPLQFYAPQPPVGDPNSFYPSTRPNLDGNVGAQGSIIQDRTAGFGGNIQSAPGGWWTAFGTGGFEGEPPLLEGAQLSSSPSSIRLIRNAKSWALISPTFAPNR
jgi:hypothetical protein